MKVAVVGSGCSGLGAAWALNEYSQHEVHVYESDDRPGGHANTVKFTNPATGDSTMVDMGFIVFNPPTYPNFLRFLRLLKVPVQTTNMSFAVTRDEGEFEWGGDNLISLFAQPRNLLSPSMWRMVWDILRFNASVRRFLAEAEAESTIPDRKSHEDAKETTIGEYLRLHGYSNSFRDDYLLPITTSIWSTPPNQASESFNARSILRFMHNHHLLQITGKPKWLTVEGGSIEYVKRVAARLPVGALRLSTPVDSIKTVLVGGKYKAILRTATGHVEEYDHVIMACHTGASLKILEKGGLVTPEERSILGGFKWTWNPTVLHSDVSALPKRKRAWCSWNYVTRSEPPTSSQPARVNTEQFALSYLMNKVQHLDMKRFGPVICTLNPTISIKEETIQARGNYEHPSFDAEAERCQKLMPTIQNTRGISYAGAWMGYGFHEDGFTAGLRAAVMLGGVKLPFVIRPADRHVDSLWMADVFDGLERIRLFVVWILIGILARFGYST